MIKSEDISKILEAARIEDVVGVFVPLKKRGANFIGLCPFHDEKTPSFNVNPARGIFKCFGCGEGGDSVAFLMKHQHYTYPEALRWLAERYHIQIEEKEETPEEKKAQSEKDRLFHVNEFAQRYFQDLLFSDPQGQSIGLSYFEERCLTKETIRRWGLGYCKDSWDDFCSAARKEGYTDEELVKAGVAIRNENSETIYDRFRARITFPIFNIGGRVLGFSARIVDGSGSYECHYDALGNVTDETRTIALPQHGEVYRFRMLYRYDSWGRMHTMTYPDGEEITYTYQWGGDLLYMHGNKNGNDRTYIREIQYNSFGQKENVNYGNGTSAHYTYDALHRLVNLQSTDSLGNLMQDIDYTFDNASNVTGIVNDAGVVNTLGGAYGNTYTYDALHRLEESYGGGAVGNYNTHLTYSSSGRLIGKFRDNNSVTLSASVDMAYGYCDENQPHAVRRIFDDESHQLFDLRWDEAGNLGQVSMAKLGDMFEAGRFLFWTEDNRMHAAVDDRYYSYYAYDHSGERRLKLTGDNKLLDVNADFMATYTILNKPTLYPSAYMVLTEKGYTNVTEVESRASSLALPRCSNVTERKHYYAGTERVAARLGGGGLDALYRAIGTDNTIQTKAGLLFDQSLAQMNSRLLPENDLNCIMQNVFAKEEFGHPIEGIPYQMQANVRFNHSQFKDMMNSMLADLSQGDEPDVYFYHSDHLGSASWKKERFGKPFASERAEEARSGILHITTTYVQHIQYLPYGEPYINQRLSGYNERFTFTGKELDAETGYGYFGARYMDHELMTMWLSVDPMADKYPNITPYAYCAWNPVKLVDPDGKDWYEKTDENGTKTVEWCKNKASCPSEGRYLGLTYHDKDNCTYYPLYGQKGISYDANNRYQVDAVNQMERTDNSIIRIVNGIKCAHNGSQNFWDKHNDMINMCSDIVSAGADITKSTLLKKMLNPIGVYATANSVLDYVKTIKNGSWNTSTTISLAADVSSLVGGFYGNVISFYLNGINYASKKGAEAESALRSYFSPLTPNNYYKNCFGF